MNGDSAKEIGQRLDSVLQHVGSEPVLKAAVEGLAKFRGLYVALSGGPDSAALVWLSAAAGIRPHLLHVNHHLRASSHACEHSARGLAQLLGFELTVLHADPEAIRSSEDGQEAGARRVRYAAFEAEILRTSAISTQVATAHTADDRLENLLLRVCAGTGVRGLDGPRESLRLGKIEMVRPVLGVPRQTLHGVLDAAEWTASTDETNLELRFVRNRIRAELMPTLLKIAGGDAAHRSAAQIAEDAQLLREFVQEAALGVAHSWSEKEVCIDRRSLQNLTGPKQAAVVRHWLDWLGAPRVTQNFVRRIVAAGCSSSLAGNVQGHRVRAELSGGRLVLGLSPNPRNPLATGG